MNGYDLPTAPAKGASTTTSDLNSMELFSEETLSLIRFLKEEECKLNFAIVSGWTKPYANGSKRRANTTVDTPRRPLQNKRQRRATTGWERKFPACKQSRLSRRVRGWEQKLLARNQAWLFLYRNM